MITRNEIISAAHRYGFEDIGFTSADPFDTHLEILKARQEEYG